MLISSHYLSCHFTHIKTKTERTNLTHGCRSTVGRQGDSEMYNKRVLHPFTLKKHQYAH